MKIIPKLLSNSFFAIFYFLFSFSLIHQRKSWQENIVLELWSVGIHLQILKIWFCLIIRYTHIVYKILKQLLLGQFGFTKIILKQYGSTGLCNICSAEAWKDMFILFLKKCVIFSFYSPKLFIPLVKSLPEMIYHVSTFYVE